MADRPQADRPGALLLRRFDDETSPTISQLVFAAEAAESIDELRQIEVSAAALYFGAWSGGPECAPRFAAQDRRHVPLHWSRYEGRRSVLSSSNSNRKAERPVNAILNYVCSLVEAEAVLACQAVGLDPGLGLAHFDTRARQSLALDVMEPVRPEFAETTDGHVRLRSPLTHELAETLPRWSQSLASVAEHVAHAFGQVMAGRYQAATLLTRRRTRDAQAVVKARREATQQAAALTATRQRSVSAAALPRWTCPECGAAVANARRGCPGSRGI